MNKTDQWRLSQKCNFPVQALLLNGCSRGSLCVLFSQTCLKVISSMFVWAKQFYCFCSKILLASYKLLLHILPVNSVQTSQLCSQGKVIIVTDERLSPQAVHVESSFSNMSLMTQDSLAVVEILPKSPAKMKLICVFFFTWFGSVYLFLQEHDLIV